MTGSAISSCYLCISSIAEDDCDFSSAKEITLLMKIYGVTLSQ